MIKIVAAILFVFSGSLFVEGQTLIVSKGTTAEEAALAKAVPVIEQILDDFNDNDWDKTQDYYSGDIAVNRKPEVSMDINCNFEREYEVKGNSRRYNTLIKPLDDKIMALTQQGNYKDAEALGKQVKAINKIMVDVYINRENTHINEPGNPGTKISAGGVPVCYKINTSHDGIKENTYWLLFGNWQTATVKRYGLAYHFIHPPKTPFIENITIVIAGADDRIQELLKTIDWRPLQNALTP